MHKPQKNLTLKIALVTRGLTQRGAAALVHVNEPRFSRIVNGREAPSPRVRAALAHLLKRPAAELFPAAPQDRPAA